MSNRHYRFVCKLKELLERRGMTQKELAEITGLREATISEMARDMRNTYNKDHIIKVMDALGIVELDKLIELRVDL